MSAAAWVEVRGLDLRTLEGRPLFRGLHLSLGAEQVAVIGRNGVGKSTLLRLLAGAEPHERVVRRGRVAWVPQVLDRDEVIAQAQRVRRSDELGWRAEASRLGLGAGELPTRPSLGELRKLALLAAFLSGAELLLLDEPTEDLDEAGRRWLSLRVQGWRQGLAVVSHDAALLGCFVHFFVVAESGCRYLRGRFDEVEGRLGAEEHDRQVQYVRNLQVMVEQEAHDVKVRQRRSRKKARGRLCELKRCTPKVRLNRKRSNAQVSQGRVAKVREQRISAVRGWAKAARRALRVQLPLALQVPEPGGEAAVLSLRGVGARVGDRWLWRGLELSVGAERVAVVGPNGAGKTTLLRIARGELAPDEGQVRIDGRAVAGIAQGASDWSGPESLLARLADEAGERDPARLAELLVAHRFPLALAERALGSLSPGERARAALICLFARRPSPRLLVLDEPTFSLDRVGLAALSEALRAWRGGLLVASHDAAFLDALGIDRWVTLDGAEL